MCFNIWSKWLNRFLLKKCSKNSYLGGPINPDHSKVGPQILKVVPVSICSLKYSGHRLSNEVLGSPLASKLSDWRPLEIFLGEALKKCKNWHFLLLLLLLENFVKKNSTRIGPCERARTQLSEYVWHMGVRMIIGQVITAQSQDMAAKVKASSKLWAVKKKDTATIFKIDARHRISVELTHIVQRWFDLEHQFWKLWPCLFFWTAHNFDDELTFAAMSWLWAVITWPIIILTPMCHTYSESWVRALSHGLILVKIVFTKFLRRSERSKKFNFLQFSVSPPPWAK